MSADVQKRVTLIEILDVTGPFAEATQLVSRAIERLAREGVPGLTSMEFYQDEARRELSAVITFADSDDMLAHTRMISGWEEFRRFATMIQLKEMRIHGQPSAEVLAWIRQFPGPVRIFERSLAEFRR